MAGPLHADMSNGKPESMHDLACELSASARMRFGLPETEPLPPLLLLSDERRLPNPEAAIRDLPAGSGFIFRHYSDPYREQNGLRLREAAMEANVIFSVGGDVELACRLGADGLHLPEFQLEIAEQDTLSEFRFVTAAAHCSRALDMAFDLGVGAALLSPVFATRSHPGAETLGARRAMELATSARLPVYALGGVKPDTAGYLAQSDFAGFAGIDGLSAPAF